MPKSNLALQLDEAQQDQQNEIIQFCEDQGLCLRLTFAVMAIIEGHRSNQPARIQEAQHWIGHHLQTRVQDLPEGKIDPVRHRAVATLTEAKKTLRALEKPETGGRAPKAKVALRGAVAGERPKKQVNPERTGKKWGFERVTKQEGAGKGRKFCPQCGEARGVRAFVGGSDVCTTCITGAKPESPKPRANSLAEAETM